MIILIILAVIVVLFGWVVFVGAPYLPSHSREVKAAFRELYQLKPTDVLVDVGSGDGIILRLAAREGARAIGYEINPILVVISWILARGNKRIQVKLTDFWQQPLSSETTIVYAFSVSRDVDKLAAKLQQEANRLTKPLFLMTYGAPLRHRKATTKRRGHHLYEFVPLQQEKP
jgi:hypothetical protein